MYKSWPGTNVSCMYQFRAEWGAALIAEFSFKGVELRRERDKGMRNNGGTLELHTLTSSIRSFLNRILMRISMMRLKTRIGGWVLFRGVLRTSHHPSALLTLNPNHYACSDCSPTERMIYLRITMQYRFDSLIIEINWGEILALKHRARNLFWLDVVLNL